MRTPLRSRLDETATSAVLRGRYVERTMGASCHNLERQW